MASLTTTEYADKHGVSTSTVRRWIAEFLIYAEKIGNKFYIPEDEPPPVFEEQVQEGRDFFTDDFGSEDLPEEDDFDELVEPSDQDVFRDLDEFPEEEEETEDCEDPENFETSNLRKSFSSREEAEDYAGDIPVPSHVFKRCSDGFFQVAIDY